VGSSSVVGGQCSRRAPEEAVDEHGEGQRQQSLATGGRVGLDSMIRFLGDELLVMQPSVPSVA
jgi:hypothetical protein